MLTAVTLALCLQTPVHEWRLTADHVAGSSLKPVAGPLTANITGPIVFGSDSAKALVLDGDSKKKHGIIVTSDLAAAKLPSKKITVEAWVRIEKPLEWGGLVGALQDNGSFEKGWILGFNNSQFCFGLAGDAKRSMTYLKAKSHFQRGYWYHVVGVYDGSLMSLYVNGKLAGSSKDQAGGIAYPPKSWLTLGVYKDDDEHHTLAGQMQSAAIFDTALSGDQVAARFQERKSNFPDMDAKPPVVTDWPTYLRDNLRTGATPEPIATPLHLAWTHRTRFAPTPGWPEEAKNDYWHNKYSLEERVTFDRAYHLVAVGDRVYFGSSAEDAVVCLDAATGRLLWTFVTEGPVRLAPTVADGRLYFGSDDGHAYCISARDGGLIWKRLLAPTPRRIAGNSRVISAWPVRTDVLVEKDKAYVCAGVLPSQGVYQYALDIETGDIVSKKTLTVTAQGYQARMFGKLMIGTGRNPQGAFVGDLKAAGRDVDREANTLGKDFPYAFISAGPLHFGGGKNRVAAFDGTTGKKIWEASVQGKAYSVIAVKDRLLVSTDEGVIHCFTPTPPNGGPTVIASPPKIVPAEADATASVKIDLALQRLGSKRRGYALVLGGKESTLPERLAARTEFDILIREPNETTARSRHEHDRSRNLDARIHTHLGGFDELPYADGLFNVVFLPKSIPAKSWDDVPAEIRRVVRPHGGVLVVDDKTAFVTQGVAGEGEWTHQYGDAGNSACSKEDNLNGELMLQWFGKPGPQEMIDRHHRTAAPLSKNGRLFVPGEDRVIAVDAYNGTILWDQPFPDSRRVVVFRDASYLALDDEHLFLASGNTVKRLDPETGSIRFEHALPAALGPREWGYLARSGSVLVGSAVKPGSSRRTQSAVVDRTETYYDFVPLVCSEALFALDAQTGKTLWTHRAKGLIPNPAIAADGETVYFLESRNAKTLEAKLSRAKMFDLVAEAGVDAVALDLKTGQERWRREVPLTKLDHIVYVTTAKDRVILSGSRNSSRDKKTGTVWYDLFVLDAKTGAEKWAVSQDTRLPIGGDHGEQDQHPVVVGDKVYQEPYCYDLETGSRLEWKWPWVGKRRAGCGTLTASNGQFFFRNQTTSMFDLTEGTAKPVTTETRPGCWVNVLPVAGLLLAPEASSGCTCNFSVQTSLALTPVRKK